MAIIAKEDAIKCMFFAEFHPRLGPKIRCQVPENFISKESFDALNVYIITKPQLQNRLITINSDKLKIMGYPLCIKDPKYARNQLIFNICFVFDSQGKTRKYEAAVKKLARYLSHLERESEFLSKEDNNSKLVNVMERILIDMNTSGVCAVQIDQANTIHLKAVEVLGSTVSNVGDHQVPVFLTNKNDFELSQWDLTTQQILKFVDGFNHVDRIATEAEVDVSLVKICIQNLLVYGVIRLLPIFQYSNVYVTTDRVGRLLTDRHLQAACVDFVSHTPAKRPHVRDVVTVVCSMRPATTVRDWCVQHSPRSLHIDERRLVQFCLIHGLVRRIQKYPVALGPARLELDPKVRKIVPFLSGKHSYDEICCKMSMTYQELDTLVESEQGIVICWK